MACLAPNKFEVEAVEQRLRLGSEETSLRSSAERSRPETMRSLDEDVRIRLLFIV